MYNLFYNDNISIAPKKVAPFPSEILHDYLGKGANPRKTNNGETTSMLATARKRQESLSFDQLKAKAEAKNLDLVRHPKSGFRIFFKESNSTIRTKSN